MYNAVASFLKLIEPTKLYGVRIPKINEDDYKYLMRGLPKARGFTYFY